jgi:MoxR-like ATPase
MSRSPAARFDGTDTYVATDDLKLAVNAALTLQRPLLIKGEPGTGKTMLAEEVARALGMPLLTAACTTSRITSSAACCGRPSTSKVPRCC